MQITANLIKRPDEGDYTAKQWLMIQALHGATVTYTNELGQAVQGVIGEIYAFTGEWENKSDRKMFDLADIVSIDCLSAK